MALSMVCSCGARFELEDTLAGQEVLCPECAQTLKAPAAAGRPPVRTSMLALVSAVLAVTGALTVIGTVAAVVCGLLALVQISRQRERLAGAGLALFGIVFGSLFTAVTVLAITSTEWFDLGGKLRQGMLASEVDTTGDLEMRIKTGTPPMEAFVLTRPSRKWGEALRKQLDEPFVKVFEEPSDVLLVQTARFVFVDGRCERGKFQTLDFCEKQVMDRLREEPPGAKGGRGDDLPQVTRMHLVTSRRLPPPLDDRDKEMPDVDGKELEVEVGVGGQTWRFLIRLYKTETNRLYVLRAYGAASRFRHAEPELRQVLDSFRIIPPR
jgi:hypothetical protein